MSLFPLLVGLVQEVDQEAGLDQVLGVDQEAVLVREVDLDPVWESQGHVLGQGVDLDQGVVQEVGPEALVLHQLDRGEYDKEIFSIILRTPNCPVISTLDCEAYFLHSVPNLSLRELITRSESVDVKMSDSWVSGVVGGDA